MFSEFLVSRPYKEDIYTKYGTKETYRVRTFGTDIEDRELIWHRDKESRRVSVWSGTGWQLQLDDKLPETLEIGKKYEIPRLTYHRVLKGEGNLIIRIENI